MLSYINITLKNSLYLKEGITMNTTIEVWTPKTITTYENRRKVNTAFITIGVTAEIDLSFLIFLIADNLGTLMYSLQN